MDNTDLKKEIKEKDNLVMIFVDLKFTWRYLCMNQAAVLPSFTDSTVVAARPPRSPPQNAHGTLICIVSVHTSGRPHLLKVTGAMAFLTA